MSGICSAVGGTADVMLGDRVKLTADAAYVRASQKAVDNHYFTFEVDPASGKGDGFQVDAIIAYQFSSAFDIGVGVPLVAPHDQRNR